MKTHVQCTMRKGTSHQVVWIPSSFADVGHPVKIQGEDGWVVVGAATGSALGSKWVSERGRDHAKMRSMTDI